MNIRYAGLKEINGPLVCIEGVKDVAYDEIASILLEDGSTRLGRVVQMDGDRVILQVFEGTTGLSLENTKTVFKGKPLEIPLSTEMLGRVFNGAGRPADGLGEVFAAKYGDINGRALNPAARRYPRNYIHTGISSIDCLMTLIRGQKLPIFSGSGMAHNKLAVQIVKQARIAEENGKDFGVVFAAMGVQNDVADYFRRSFEEAGA
ncbi:MAG: V-type ATP synthase subunit B, partial [Ruminiclostridium sp.]